jgi:hypothetical protein
MSGDRRAGSGRLLGSGLLTVVLLLVLVGLQTLTELGATSNRDAAWLYFTESLFIVLPIAAALLAGQVARLDMRALAVACALITLLMVGQDFLPPSGLTTSKRHLAFMPLTQEWAVLPVVDARDGLRWTEGGAFPLVVGYLTGRAPHADVEQEIYLDSAPRMQVAWAMFKFGYLFGPFIVVGFVAAIRVWVQRHVRFRTRSSERLFAFIVSWVVGPLVLGFLVFVGERTMSWGVGPWGPPAILIPYLVFGVTAGFGWVAGIRAQRTAAYLDDIPVDE